MWICSIFKVMAYVTIFPKQNVCLSVCLCACVCVCVCVCVCLCVYVYVCIWLITRPHPKWDLHCILYIKKKEPHKKIIKANHFNKLTEMCSKNFSITWSNIREILHNQLTSENILTGGYICITTWPTSSWSAAWAVETSLIHRTSPTAFSKDQSVTQCRQLTSDSKYIGCRVRQVKIWFIVHRLTHVHNVHHHTPPSKWNHR
jgi:hypothetical protein